GESVETESGAYELEAQLGRLKDVALAGLNRDLQRTDESTLTSAVRYIRDPILLARVVREAQCEATALAAVRGLKDQAILGDIALHHPSLRIRAKATERIDDPSVRLAIIRNEITLSKRARRRTRPRFARRSRDFTAIDS